MRRLVLLLLALTVAVALPACGGEEDESATPETVEGTVPEDGGEDGGAGGKGDPENGESVFADAGCGSCHTLSAAGSSGTIGPNLDDSSADFQAAVAQISNGGNGMPAFKGRISDEEIANVAAFVVEERG